MSSFEVIHVLILIATIAAIIIGPILAVRITRQSDIENANRSRKLDVLRGLMKTRRMKLHPEHVAALNLIELEFYGIEPVLNSYRAYIGHLASPAPAEDQQEIYFEDRDALFAELLNSVAKAMDYKFDKMDLGRLGYSPIGWERDEYQTRLNSKLLTELLQGKRPLPVTDMKPTPESMFPPPPEPLDKAKPAKRKKARTPRDLSSS